MNYNPFYKIHYPDILVSTDLVNFNLFVQYRRILTAIASSLAYLYFELQK